MHNPKSVFHRSGPTKDSPEADQREQRRPQTETDTFTVDEERRGSRSPNPLPRQPGCSVAEFPASAHTRGRSVPAPLQRPRSKHVPLLVCPDHSRARPPFCLLGTAPRPLARVHEPRSEPGSVLLLGYFPRICLIVPSSADGASVLFDLPEVEATSKPHACAGSAAQCSPVISSALHSRRCMASRPPVSLLPGSEAVRRRAASLSVPPSKTWARAPPAAM